MAKLEENFGSEIDGSTGQHPGTDSPGSLKFADMVGGAYFDATSPFTPKAKCCCFNYACLQAANSAEPGDYKSKVMDVANAPGELIYPGELGKALDILAAGGEM